MAQLIRHTAVWTGAPGLPGYTQFYQEVTGSIPGLAQGAHDNVRAMFNALANIIPADITVTVDPLYQVLMTDTGELVAEDAVGTPSSVVAGSFVSGWSAQVGVLVEWLTGFYINGRQLRGRTYLVPLGNSSDDDGTLPSGTLSTVAAAADYIVSGGSGFVVWHRPVNELGGEQHPIITAVIRDHAAVLRSRMI